MKFTDKNHNKIFISFLIVLLALASYNFIPIVKANPTVIFTTVSVTSVRTCPLDTHTFVIAYHDEVNDDFSFQIWDTNGTQVLAETDVDTTSGSSLKHTSVGVSAFNSTTFVIGWHDQGQPDYGDATFAIYNRAGTLLSGPTDADTDVSGSYSVQVSCFNSTYFVIAWGDAIDQDATFSVYTSSSVLKAGPIDVDTSIGTNSWSISVSCFNSTTFVIGWHDWDDEDATFAVYNSAGTLMTGPIDVDTAVSFPSPPVSVSTLNSTYFVIGWFDENDDDATFAVYNSAGTLMTGPIDVDTTAGYQCYSVQVAALNSTAFVISWYDGVDFDLSYATYLSSGTVIATNDIESWPTAANEPFKYQSPCSQETGTGIQLYNDNWIIAYGNKTTQAIWKAFKPDGTAWDGTIPSEEKTWNIVEIWKLNIYTLKWFTTEIWKLQFHNFSWFNVETWLFNIYNFTWFFAEKWLLNLHNYSWFNSETWLLYLHNFSWFNVESWKLEIYTLIWNLAEIWKINIYSYNWFISEIWKLSIYPFSWLNVETWQFNIHNFAWFTTEIWKISIGNVYWCIVELWKIDLQIPVITVNVALLYSILAIMIALVAVVFALSKEEKNK